MSPVNDRLRQLARLFLIYNMLEIGDPMRSDDLAAACSCSTKTFHRDLSLLREAGADIVYQAASRGYVLLNPLECLQVQLPLTDLLALAMSQMRADTGTAPFDSAARSALSRLLGHLPRALRDELEEAQGVVHSGAATRRDYSKAPWRALLDAARRRRTVQAWFYSISSDKNSLRRIDPYHLTLRAGYFNLVGYCHERREVRFFALDGFSDTEITDDPFQIAPGFSLARFLENSVGLLRGEPVEIVVRFDASIARWAKRRRWEFSHTLAPGEGDSLILRGTVSGTHEIQRELLSWGANVEVLEPPALRESMQREAEAIAARYIRPTE